MVYKVDHYELKLWAWGCLIISFEFHLEGDHSSRICLSHVSVRFLPSPPGGPCIKGEREQRGNSISRPQTREAPAALPSPHPPLLVSIYRWVNLLTDVPAWRTSTSSLRYLMVAPSAQHGYARHMLTPCGAAHRTWVSGKRKTGLSVYWPETQLWGRTGKNDWKVS